MKLVVPRPRKVPRTMMLPLPSGVLMSSNELVIRMRLPGWLMNAASALANRRLQGFGIHQGQEDFAGTGGQVVRLARDGVPGFADERILRAAEPLRPDGGATVDMSEETSAG